MGTPIGLLLAVGASRARLVAVVTIGVCLVLVGTGAVGSVGATHDDEPTSHFVVELDSDGSATVSLVVAFDLTNEEERDAFQSLEADETARTEFSRRFDDRMRSVATAAADETGREMTVSNASVDLSRSDDGETGTGTSTVTWSNLAARENGRLVVTAPFDSGFTPAYEFVVTVPEGYRIVEASPAPDARGEYQATWAVGTSLEGYRLVVEEDPEQRDRSRTAGQPGFGLVGGVLALSTAIWALGRRRH